MKYTVHRHVQRLERMLLHVSPCTCCPAYKRFDINNDPIKLASVYEPHWHNDFVAKYVCKICRDFVGLPEHGHGCPCKVHGDKEALKITVAALKKYHREREERVNAHRP